MFVCNCYFITFERHGRIGGRELTKKRLRFGRDLLTRVETRLFSKDYLKGMRASEQSGKHEEEFGDWVVEDLMMERLRSTGVLQ